MSADAAFARIASVSGALVDPSTLLPAEIILELSGEAVRSRLCTFVDGMGVELCLRPDLTTPIARRVAEGALPAARYHASGSVYRLPPTGSREPVEHRQIGFEWFGDFGWPEEDAEALATALEAAKAGGVAQAALHFGDVAMFRAVVSALDFDARWADRLIRSFSRRKGPRELLAVGAPTATPQAWSIGAMSQPDAVRAVEAVLAQEGLQPVGGRDATEIAERLRDKASERAPSAETANALLRYLDIRASGPDSIDALYDYSQACGVVLTAELDTYARRLQAINDLSPPFWAGAQFSAEAGRRFEYYDGFVFELARAGEGDRPIVSGGRYDGLIARLSGRSRKASAIGAALRVDRLAEGKR